MKLIVSILFILSLGLSFAQAETLTPVPGFGDNPGRIKMYKYVPEDIPANAPLVVSLHGCRQDAETYSRAGWKALAEEWKFYLIFPEQTLSNNPYRCWNWFEADNIHRGHGEIQSIIEMIDKMKTNHAIDASRIFIEGLSAGGYLTSILLATYPDVFAGGATNAGGPAFCAMTERYFWDFWGWWYSNSAIRNAEKCIRGTDKSPREWSDLVREEGYDNFNGPWPIISIWHGAADKRVAKMNQQELVDQWTDVHGIDQTADKQEPVGANGNIIHNEYHDQQGTVLVETWLIPGMSHGTPIEVDSEHSCGEEDDYILDEGICAVRKIGQFWGLDE